MNRNNFIRYYLPAIAWAIFILTITSYPSLEVPETIFVMEDKVAHFSIYFVFGFLVCRALLLAKKLPVSQVIIRSIVFCCIFAILDECHQWFIPGRGVEVFDIIANIGGILGSTVLFLGYVRFFVSRDSQRDC